MLFTPLARKLQFLPLGMFWGVVTAVLNVDNFNQDLIVRGIQPVDLSADWMSIFITVGPAIFAFLIAIRMGSDVLRRESSPILWSVNWVVIGVSSCVAGVAISILAISILAFSLLYSISWSYLYPLESWSNLYSAFQLIVRGIFSGWMMAFWMLVAPILVQSLVFASSSLPVALVVRRLMIGAGQVSEPAGGESQTQP